VLAAFGLTADNDAAGNVRDANGGFDFVDVLSAFAAGTERVDLQILGTNVDLDFVVDFWNYKPRGKRSMAPCRLIERTNSNPAVDSRFARQQTIRVFYGKLDDR